MFHLYIILCFQINQEMLKNTDYFVIIILHGYY